jgi:hypothetical protein
VKHYVVQAAIFWAKTTICVTLYLVVVYGLLGDWVLMAVNVVKAVGAAYLAERAAKVE